MATDGSVGCMLMSCWGVELQREQKSIAARDSYPRRLRSPLLLCLVNTQLPDRWASLTSINFIFLEKIRSELPIILRANMIISVITFHSVCSAWQLSRRCCTCTYFVSLCVDRILFFIDLKQNAAQCACTESTHKGVHQRSKDVTQTKQQRPESPTVTLTWHASKYKVYKLHQRWELP